jgi:hypothetical protein
MDPTLILADQILTLIRSSGYGKMEAFAALEIAGSCLVPASDVAFTNDDPYPVETETADRTSRPFPRL